MTDKLNGSGKHNCDVCGRAYTWGCGHSGSQEYASRKHRATRRHKERRCACFGHDHCDPKSCKLAQTQTPGYAPFYQHTEERTT